MKKNRKKKRREERETRGKKEGETGGILEFLWCGLGGVVVWGAEFTEGRAQKKTVTEIVGGPNARGSLLQKIT